MGEMKTGLQGNGAFCSWLKSYGLGKGFREVVNTKSAAVGDIT